MKNAPVLLVIVLCQFGCGTTPVDLQAEREALERVREQHRLAHFDRGAELLVSSFAGDFRNIQAGTVAQPPAEESVQRFQAYFDASTFLAWDDVEPPVIRIADDGSMAYVVVQKRIQLRERNAPDDAAAEETFFAWLETWEKEVGTWKLKALASTRQPSE